MQKSTGLNEIIRQMDEQRHERHEGLRLGQLIHLLEAIDDDQTVAFDFGYFRPVSVESYRGYYTDIAISYSDRSSIIIRDFLPKLKGAVGSQYTGYKGGEFTMSENTIVWVANYGEVTDVIVKGVSVTDAGVIIRTEKVG